MGAPAERHSIDIRPRMPLVQDDAWNLLIPSCSDFEKTDSMHLVDAVDCWSYYPILMHGPPISAPAVKPSKEMLYCVFFVQWLPCPGHQQNDDVYFSLYSLSSDVSKEDLEILLDR